MTNLRNRVVVLVSTLVIAVALIVLPGCKKAASPKPAEKAATETKKAVEEAAK